MTVRPTGLRSFGDAADPIYAADWRACVDILKAAFRPSLVGYAPAVSDVLKATISGTKLTYGAIQANTFVVTGNAKITELVDDELDFATAGVAGGPLPSGTYQVYWRVQFGGTESNRYFTAYPAASTEGALYGTDDDAHADAQRVGLIDRTVYLVTASVAWNGSTTLSALVDRRTNSFGPFDLTLLGSGIGGYVALGNANRGVEMTGLLLDSLFVDNVYLNANANVYGLGNVRFEFNGHTEFSFGNGAGPSTLFDMGKNTDLQLREGSVLDLLDDAILNLAAAGHFNVHGAQHVKNNALFEVQSGGVAYFQDGCVMLVPPTLAFAATNRSVAWGQFIRAGAAVASAGTLIDGHNVASASQTATGVYDVTFSTAMATVNYGAIAIANSTTAPRHVEVDKATNKVTVKIFDLGGSPADSAFTVVVFFGQLV